MSEWNYKPTPRDCEYITEWLAKFKDKQMCNPHWHEPRWTEFHENGKYLGGHWDCGGFQCSDEFMQKLLVHPVVKDNVFTGVWMDEALEYDKQIKPKKQKSKHTQPFWTKNWRGRN